MIKKISFHQLYKGEYFTFAQRVLNILSRFNFSNQIILTLISKLNDAFQLLNTAQTKVSTKQSTIQISDADARRDGAFNAFKAYIDACNKRIKPEWQVPSGLLLDTIRKYGWTLQKESYAKQTAQMTSLLGDLKNETELKTAVRTLNAQEWVDDIEQAESQFEQSLEQRTISNAGVSDVDSDEACKAIRLACEKLFQYVNVMLDVAPSDDLTSVTNQINEVIGEFSTQIRARQTRAESVDNESLSKN